MAYTSATRALGNPRHITPVTVQRRAETLDAHGRSVVTVSATFTRVPLAIVAGDNQDLQRQADGQYMGKRLSVVCRFSLRGPAPGFQPDIVSFRGDTFVVTHVDDYSGYGPGWVQAILSSMDVIDAAPGTKS